MYPVTLAVSNVTREKKSKHVNYDILLVIRKG